MTIYWLGAGLSSWPGIRRLARQSVPLVVVDSTPGMARESLGGACESADALETGWQSIEPGLMDGDIVISMLPTDCHPAVAAMCVQRRAHMVCASYLCDAMREMHVRAAAAGVSLVSEVGLDPGIDHLLAHRLISRYRSSSQCSHSNRVYFRSYCGGIPARPNPFKYKFSWSPLGVLKALNSPAQWIERGQIQESLTPWSALRCYDINTVVGYPERFEVYPNRDSLPYIPEYGFDESWNIQEFVRGSLRLSGWADAWQPVFETLSKQAESPDDEALQTLSDQLLEGNEYAWDEPDRVVLRVELEVRSCAEDVLWHECLQFDVTGNHRGSAMAQLVSLPVSLAVEQIVRGETPSGVVTAPSQPDVIDQWLAALAMEGLACDHQILAELCSVNYASKQVRR